jgi:hypothetical protein
MTWTFARALTLVAVVAVTVVACSSGDDEADEATTTTTTLPSSAPETVTVTGPITGGVALANAALQDLDSFGYEEAEYFIEGDATSYTDVGTRSADGQWTVEESGSSPFKTRIIVRRPTDPADFSGVVLVEWMNVTAGRDGDPDWGYLHDEIMREGHAWVGVSTQAVGVMGGDPLLGGVALEGGLVGSDPQRYGTLSHPGDVYAFDIFTHAAVAVRDPDGPAPLGDLEPTHVLAVGESQSAFYLTSYVNGIHPITYVFDGFLIHSRGGGAPLFDDPGLRGEELGGSVTIRTDLAEPVLMFETETDLTTLSYYPARQDDTDAVRLWEVAGTAHADSYLIEKVYNVGANVDVAGILNCPQPLNAGPQHEVVQAALHHLVAWVRDGTLPPEAPRLEVTVEGDAPVIQRDEYGNALGGIRTPLVDVPAATLSGDPVEGGGSFCFLFGSTTPLDPATLAELYPSHVDYVAAFTESAEAAVDAGFLLRPDAEAMIAEAEASDVGS